MQVCHQVAYQACWLHQVASSLLASSSCIKSVGFIKLHQACWLHQVASSLLASSSYIKPADSMHFDASCWWNDFKFVDKKLLTINFAPSPWTSCSRLAVIKREQAMRTHPDIGLMTARSASRLIAILAFLVVSAKRWTVFVFSIFTQVNIRNPTLWLVQYDVTFLYMHLQVNITVKTSLQNGD